MALIDTADLKGKQNRLQGEIVNLQAQITTIEKSIQEKRIEFNFLENLIKWAELKDSENKNPIQDLEINKEPIIDRSSVSFSSIQNPLYDKIIAYLKLEPNNSARTSSITKTLASWNRDLQLKVSNALMQLCKQWRIEIIKEQDSTGADRQRNRLYKLILE